LRASRRTATGEIVLTAILRDAVLRTAPQDEVCGIKFHPSDMIGFVESIHEAGMARIHATSATIADVAAAPGAGEDQGVRTTIAVQGSCQKSGLSARGAVESILLNSRGFSAQMSSVHSPMLRR
jgi:hypothetical protein